MKSRILKSISELKSRVVAFLLCLVAYPVIYFTSKNTLSVSLKDIGSDTGLNQHYVSLLKLLVKRGRKGILFHRHSLPVSSSCNTWADSTYDAALRSEWVLGKEKDFSGTSFKEKLINFIANLSKHLGLFSLSWSLYELLIEKDSTDPNFLGYLGQFDISILIKGWHDQLEDYYYAHNIWFNPQKIDGFNDDLCWFFDHCDQCLIEKKSNELKKLRSNSSVVQEIWAEYYERKGEYEKALTRYRLACTYNPGNGSAKVRLQNAESLSGNHVQKGDKIARILTARTICEKMGWDYQEFGNQQRLKFEYTVFINHSEETRFVDMEFNRTGLAVLKNVQNLGGGLVESSEGKKSFVVQDSKHLDITHLKLFSPLLKIHNRKNALIVNNSDSDLVWEKAFLFPGLGWNYYHWLIEIIPLLWIYETSGLKGKYPLAFQFPLKKWHVETLNLLGYSEVDLIPYFPETRAVFEDVSMPMFCSRDLVASPESISFLRERLSRHTEIKKGKYIYLTRKGVDAVRKSNGINKLESYLKKQNYEFVDPSRMSLKKQIEYFSDVDIVISQGGAALANLAFCPKGTRVIIISGERAWAETFTTIAAVAELELNVILCRSKPYPNPYYLWTAFDYEINSDEIIKYIDSLSGKS